MDILSKVPDEMLAAAASRFPDAAAETENLQRVIPRYRMVIARRSRLRGFLKRKAAQPVGLGRQPARCLLNERC
jgi:hypothetical protein